MTKALTPHELEEILGSKERVLFYLTWIKHGRNATRAYMELHPTVSEKSAGVLGSKMLGNIKMEAIADAYGLTKERWMSMVDDGLEATKTSNAAVLLTKDGKTVRAEEQGLIEVPDHYTRLKYHDKLGKLLNIEVDNPATAIGISGKDMSIEFVARDKDD